MSGKARRYDISQVSFIWGTLELTEGLEDGSKIVVTPVTAEKVTAKLVGVRGVDVVYTRHKSRLVTVQMTFAAEHELAQLMKSISELDDVSNNQIADGLLKDHSTGQQISLSHMILSQDPADEFGFEASENVFTWFAVRRYTPGTFTKNIVGEGIEPATVLGEEEEAP